MSRRGNLRLVEGQGNDLMTAEIAHVADLDGKIVPRLPWNVQSLVHGVRQLVGAIVIGKREQRGAERDCRRVGQLQISRIAAGRGPESGAPRVFEVAAIRIPESIARRLIHPGRSLIYSKWTASDNPRREAGREVREEFSAIVVQTPACAHHNFVVEHARAPGQTHARCESPLPPSESGIADPLGGKVRIVPRDNEAVRIDYVVGYVVVVARGIEIENAAVLFFKAPVIVEAETSAKAEVRPNLKFVLQVHTGFVGSVVAVGIALQECRGDESVRGVGNR